MRFVDNYDYFARLIQAWEKGEAASEQPPAPELPTLAATPQRASAVKSAKQKQAEEEAAAAETAAKK